MRKCLDFHSVESVCIYKKLLQVFKFIDCKLGLQQFSCLSEFPKASIQSCVLGVLSQTLEKWVWTRGWRNKNIAAIFCINFCGGFVNNVIIFDLNFVIITSPVSLFNFDFCSFLSWFDYGFFKDASDLLIGA
jgi:hypothetical protein